MILVTGFQGYGGRSANPSELVARALDGVQIGGAMVRGHVLPVDFHGMCRDLPALIDDMRPRIIVSLGLWPGEPMLRIERMAANWSWFELPDNTGHRQNGQVHAGGPDGYLSTLPADAMQAAIRAAGLPCRLRDWCRGKIAHYRVPRYIRFVSEMPMTVTGKPQKFIMRDKMMADLGLSA